jgi:hypothetical protein
MFEFATGDYDPWIILIFLLSGLQSAVFAQTGQLRLAPSSLNFGDQIIGAPGAPQSVTLSNLGATSVPIQGFAVSGEFSGDFSQTTNCGAQLGPGANCTIAVAFRPAGTGSRASALSVMVNAVAGPPSVSLSGTGSAACADITACAYQLLLGRATANSSAFLVYLDSDSGFNHGFPSAASSSARISTPVRLLSTRLAWTPRRPQPAAPPTQRLSMASAALC